MSDAHAPTTQLKTLVELMALAGSPQSTIAKVLDISVPTLTAHYREELDLSKPRRLAQVAGIAFQMAVGRPAKFDGEGRMTQSEIKPDRTMVMFILKTQAGWKETSVVELSDPSAGARDRLASAIDRFFAAGVGGGGPEAEAAKEPDRSRPN
jgi:hypothetical protein